MSHKKPIPLMRHALKNAAIPHDSSRWPGNAFGDALRDVLGPKLHGSR